MSHFTVIFEGVELTDEQTPHVKSALEEAAKKILKVFPVSGPPKHPGDPVSTGGSGTSTGSSGTGKPVKGGSPIVFQVSYDASGAARASLLGPR